MSSRFIVTRTWADEKVGRIATALWPADSCSEFMARPAGSTFEDLAVLQGTQYRRYSWGFVAGKTQTIYPWDSWSKKYDAEPKVWFHDILRQWDALRRKKVALIKGLTKR